MDRGSHGVLNQEYGHIDASHQPGTTGCPPIVCKLFLRVEERLKNVLRECTPVRAVHTVVCIVLKTVIICRSYSPPHSRVSHVPHHPHIMRKITEKTREKSNRTTQLHKISKSFQKKEGINTNKNATNAPKIPGDNHSTILPQNNPTIFKLSTHTATSQNIFTLLR